MTIDEALQNEKFVHIILTPSPYNSKPGVVSIMKRTVVNIEDVKDYVFDSMHSDDCPRFKKI